LNLAELSRQPIECRVDDSTIAGADLTGNNEIRRLVLTVASEIEAEIERLEPELKIPPPMQG